MTYFHIDFWILWSWISQNFWTWSGPKFLKMFGPGPVLRILINRIFSIASCNQGSTDEYRLVQGQTGPGLKKNEKWTNIFEPKSRTAEFLIRTDSNRTRANKILKISDRSGPVGPQTCWIIDPCLNYWKSNNYKINQSRQLSKPISFGPLPSAHPVY